MINELSQLCCNEFEQFVGGKVVFDSEDQSQPFDEILCASSVLGHGSPYQLLNRMIHLYV